MYLVYIDDSGDTGFKSGGSITDAFVLSAVLIRDADWLATLDELKAWRRELYAQYHIRQRDEIKAGYFIHGTGPFRGKGFSTDERMHLYKTFMGFQREIGTIRTWAIVIDKDAWEARGWAHIPLRQVAWENMIERIERFTNNGQESCSIYPDEGHPKFVRQLFRQKRRFSYVPSAYQPGQRLRRDATFIVEDPSFRKSIDSYYVQLADFNAYAAYRRVFPQPYCGEDLWQELGDARVREVNALQQQKRAVPTGIVLRP